MLLIEVVAFALFYFFLQTCKKKHHVEKERERGGEKIAKFDYHSFHRVVGSCLVGAAGSET